VLGERANQAEGDNLVGEPGTPVRSLRHPELLIQPQQVLLDGRLGHYEVTRDLPGGGGRDERVVGQRGTAQGDEHVELPARQFGGCGAAQLGIGVQVVARYALDPAARRTEAQHVAVVEYPAGDRTAVHPRAVT